MAGAGSTDVIEVDARGLYCPLPILRLSKALVLNPRWIAARLFATDPATSADVEAFCRERGHTLHSSRREGPVLVFEIEKRSS